MHTWLKLVSQVREHREKAGPSSSLPKYDRVHEKKGWKMEVGGACLCAIRQSTSMLLFI